MKHNLELKIQAWLDGELPDHEARRLGQWIARDAEASALAAELGSLKQAMHRNEAAATLEDSRAFYWSQIEQRIQRQAGARASEKLPWYAHWRRYLAPLGGVALLAGVLVITVMQNGAPNFDEFSSTAEGMEAVTFRDQSAQMTVVWLQDNSPAAPENQAEPNSIRYQDEPDTVIDLE